MKKNQERYSGSPAVVEVALAPAAAAPAKVKATRKKSKGKERGSKGKSKAESSWKDTRPPKPLFPPTPLDEMAGILLIVAGLLLAACMLRPDAMGALAPVGHWLQHSLGSGGVALVGFVLVLGAEAFLPHQAL